MATEADWNGAGQHASAPPTTPGHGQWQERVIGIASEWSPQFPGYVAGAVEAARLGVQAAQQSLGRARTQGAAKA